MQLNSIPAFKDFNPNSNLVSDSRVADQNSLFFALKGSKVDGHHFLETVYNQGCRQFVVEQSFKSKLQPHILNDSKILFVEDTKKMWAQAWQKKSNSPDLALKVFAVTGTNGKTSTTLMLEHILNSSNQLCGVLGTIDHHLKTKTENYIWPTNLTTPGAEILYPRLDEMKQKGAKAIAMEISSHALNQERAEGLNLDVAVFTNLTEDHLDYHQTLDHYFKSKVKLFNELLRSSTKSTKVSVLNYSDSWIKNYLPDFGDIEVLWEDRVDLKHKSYWVKNLKSLLKLSSKTIDHDFTIPNSLKYLNQKKNVNLNILKLKNHTVDGLEFEIKRPSSKTVLDFKIPIMGHFQAMNWSQAALAAYNLGVPWDSIIASGKTFTGVPGRLQKVLRTSEVKDHLSQKSVFVDYAHTPDALMRSLISLKQICEGKLYVVFGCGGDRDKLKRPLMAQAAEKYSDFQIITSDNPRTEDPLQILKEIQVGFKSQNFIMEQDRRQAIQLGVSKLSSKKDILLIAGKGHENYQILKEKTIPFSDYETALEFINS